MAAEKPKTTQSIRKHDANERIRDIRLIRIDSFFWFFEARKAPENAPLAIWLNGGPGASSIMGLLEENGPCFVNEDSKTTRLNPWSWNNEVNMLYIDQPTQVGFSYDIPTNITIRPGEEEHLEMFPADFSEGVPDGNYTYRYGTASSQKISQTSNTTAHAAHALWHFAQTWFFEFPFYKPVDDRVSLWGESYGGHYAPGIFQEFQTQNELIQNGTSPEKNAQYIHLDTLGIINGLIDLSIQGETWITFPYNNVSETIQYKLLITSRKCESTGTNPCKDVWDTSLQRVHL